MICGKTDESLFRIRLIERLDGWRRLSVDMSDDLREAVDGNQPFQLAIPRPLLHLFSFFSMHVNKCFCKTIP